MPHVNTMLFRLRGKIPTTLADNYVTMGRDDKISAIQRWVMKIELADKAQQQPRGSTFLKLVGNNVIGISVCDQDEEPPADRALNKPSKTAAAVVYKPGHPGKAPITPQAAQLQPVTTKFSDFPKFCAKSNVWSQLPVWQDFVQLMASGHAGMEEISNLHAFFVRMCLQQNSSNPVEQGPYRPVDSEWPEFVGIDDDWQFVLENIDLSAARDLVSGVETEGTTNPTKCCFDVFQRMYLINKDQHSQLDGEEFLNCVCRQLQIHIMVDGFQYRDVHDDGAIGDYHKSQLDNLVEKLGFANVYEMLSAVSRAVVRDGSEGEVEASQVVTP